MYLTNAGFGYFEDLADFLHGEVFVIVKGEEEALAVGEGFDGGGEFVFKFAHFDFAAGIGTGFVGDDVAYGNALVVAGELYRAVERKGGDGGAGEGVAVAAELHADVIGDFGVGGGALQLGLKPGHAAGYFADSLAGGARNPVDGAELVDDVAADSGDSVGFEFDAFVGIEALYGGDEPDEAVAQDVFGVDDVGQGDGEAAENVLDQRGVL